MAKRKLFLLLNLFLLATLVLSACAQPTAAPAPPTDVPAAPVEEPAAPPTDVPAAPPTDVPAAPVEEPTEAVVEEPEVKEPLYIGALVPQSEPGAPQAGTLILRGIELGAEYVNTVLGGSLDGRPVEIVVGDDKGTPEVGATEYRRLVQNYNIIGATGVYHSSVGLAEIEVAKELGAPVIMTQASSAAITETGYPQVFRTHLVDPIRALAMVEFAKEQGYQKIGYIADNTDFGVGLSEAVENAAADAGLEVQSMIYDKAAVDLMPELLQLQAWGPDLILNAGTGNPEHIIIDQANDIGLFPETPMLATSDWPYRTDEYWELHGDVGTGIYILTSYHKDMALTPSGEWFYNRYLAKYGVEPTYSSYNGFGDAVILAEAARLAGTTDYDAIVQALEDNEFEFWAGTVTFPKGEGIFWHQWTPPVVITQYTAPNQTQSEAELVFTFEYAP